MDNIILFPVKVDDFVNTLIHSLSAEIAQQLHLHKAQTVSEAEDANLLTREEAAIYLHITLPTLNTYTKSGRVKGYRLGGRVFYKRSELTDALKAIRTSSDYSLLKNRRA